MGKFRLKAAQEEAFITGEARLDGSAFQVTLDGETLTGELTLTGPGAGWLLLDGQVKPFYYHQPEPSSIQVWMDGQVYALDLQGGQQPRRANAPAANLAGNGDIKAPMPGTVLKVLVKAGDAVAANQPLVIMESMKMEMTLSAPVAGVVRSVGCAEGQLVDMGAMLAQVQPEPAPS